MNNDRTIFNKMIYFSAFDIVKLEFRPDDDDDDDFLWEFAERICGIICSINDSF